MAKNRKSQFTSKKAGKYRGNPTLRIIFYTVYAALTLSLAAGFLYANSRLNAWLTDYENSHPDTRSAQIFREYFADPDWARLYRLADIADSAYEGSDDFVAAMSAPGNSLTYRETSPGLTGKRKYLLSRGGETVGWFTLENRAPKGARMPDWQLDRIFLNPGRAQSVTVLAPEGVSVQINGVSLTSEHVIRIDSTQVQDFLPPGIHGPRVYTHYLEGLMTTPQVTALDPQGNPLDVSYDQELNAFVVQPEPEIMPRELYDHCLKAVTAYGQYIVNHGSQRDLDRYFDTGSRSYREILDAEPLIPEALYRRITWADETVSDFCSYGDRIFSARVRLPIEISLADGSDRQILLDRTFFFSLEENAWKCFAVTDADITEPVSHVRVTFRIGDQVIFTNMYPRDAAVLPLPTLSAPSSQRFTGWFRRETGADGALTYILVYGPDQADAVTLAPGSLLEPMTLYALFETIQ